MRPHISYSELTSFATGCQWRWKLDYLEDRRAEIFSIHFDFGTAVHEALEKYLSRKDPVDVDAAVEIFKTSLHKLTTENGPKYPEPLPVRDYVGLMASGEQIIRCIKLDPDLKDLEVVHNEYPLFEQISREDDVDMKFKGFIDIVLKGKDKRGNTILWVADFKTCSWGWDRDTRADRWKHYQLFLYKYYLCKKFNIDPANVRVAFILLKKRPPKGAGPVEFFPVSAGPVSVQRALDVLGENVTEMISREKDGSFQKDLKQCTDKFGNSCPYLKSPLCPKSP